MRNKHGDFIWYELLTDDPDAAQAFYGDVIGWQFANSDQPGMDYRILLAADDETGEAHGVGGMMALDEGMRAGGARPVWLGYVGVDDVDATVEAIAGAGGAVRMPPSDIPDVGRIAMVIDPEGAPFYVMRGSSDEVSRAFASDRPRPGHCAWNELTTGDPLGAWEFYGGRFGWTKDGEMPMGDLGAYEFIRHGGTIGAIMPKPPDMAEPLWSFYFRVPDIDRAVDRISLGGGRILNGPDEIPGGELIIKALDPQRALFALIGSGR